MPKYFVVKHAVFIFKKPHTKYEVCLQATFFPPQIADHLTSKQEKNIHIYIAPYHISQESPKRLDRKQLTPMCFLPRNRLIRQPFCVQHRLMNGPNEQISCCLVTFSYRGI